MRREHSPEISKFSPHSPDFRIPGLPPSNPNPETRQRSINTMRRKMMLMDIQLNNLKHKSTALQVKFDTKFSQNSYFCEDAGDDKENEILTEIDD